MTRSASARTSEASRWWYVYLLACEGGSIYTGITTDLRRRAAQHVGGTAARYTRAFPPREFIAAWRCADRSTAATVEEWIKQLDPAEKRRLDGDPLPGPDGQMLDPLPRGDLPPVRPQ